MSALKIHHFPIIRHGEDFTRSATSINENAKYITYLRGKAHDCNGRRPRVGLNIAGGWTDS
jgi:hypothetical protein